MAQPGPMCRVQGSRCLARQLPGSGNYDMHEEMKNFSVSEIQPPIHASRPPRRDLMAATAIGRWNCTMGLGPCHSAVSKPPRLGKYCKAIATHTVLSPNCCVQAGSPFGPEIILLSVEQLFHTHKRKSSQHNLPLRQQGLRCPSWITKASYRDRREPGARYAIW